MKKLITFAGLAFFSALAIASDLSAQDLVITNTRIIVGNGDVINQGSIVIRDGRIVSVLFAGRAGPGRARARSVRASVGGSGAGFEVFEHADLFVEQAGEHLAGDGEEFGDVRGGHRIDHGVAVLAGHHDTGPPQHGQLLGHVRGLEPDLGLQLPDRVLALREQLEDPDPGRMPPWTP